MRAFVISKLFPRFGKAMRYWQYRNVKNIGAIIRFAWCMPTFWARSATQKTGRESSALREYCMSIIRNCNVDILKRSSRSKGRKKRRARDPFLQPLLRRRSNHTAFSRCDEARLGLAISFVTLLRISRARPFLSFLSTTWRRSHFGKYNAV